MGWNIPTVGIFAKDINFTRKPKGFQFPTAASVVVLPNSYTFETPEFQRKRTIKRSASECNHDCNQGRDCKCQSQ